MSRKRAKKNPKDELNAMRKILCDEATNQMKVRNFAKALIGFNQVKCVLKCFAPPLSQTLRLRVASSWKLSLFVYL